MQPFRKAVRWWTLASMVVIPLALAYCFNPDLSQGGFRCTTDEAGMCPDGQHCIAGRCQTGVDASDASVPAVIDASADASTQPADLASRGCVQGGARVGGAWACPGVFAQGQAGSLCAAGFSVCKTADTVDTDECDRLNGFFVSQALGKSNFRLCRNVDPVNYACGAPPPGYDYRMRFGCGTLTTTYALQACQRQCGGFDRAIECQGSQGDYTCVTSNTIEDDANTYRTIGVLCCANP